MVLALDITKVRRATQWTPRLTLDDSLVDLIGAYGLQPAPSRP